MRNLKIDVKQENGVLFLNAENKRGITNDVKFAYVHDKKKRSAFCFEHLSFFFYQFILNTQNT